MHDLNRKRRNALKHGAFGDMTIYTGEEPQEFKDLRCDLRQEWMPVGATEEDAVLTIAKGIWRKRRKQKFLLSKMDKASLDHNHPGFDPRLALWIVVGTIQLSPDDFKSAVTALASHDANHLLGKFRREDFESTSAFVQAVQKEIIEVLIPRHERFGKPPLELELDRSVAILSPDDFMHEILVDERIDGMIDRAIKRLVQTKTFKQMLGLNPSGAHNRPKNAKSSQVRSLKVVGQE